MKGQRGLQLIELMLAIALLAGIVLAGNVLFMGSTSRTLAVQAQSEMGEEMTYLFKRMENFLQDIQPGVTDLGEGTQTPYVTSPPISGLMPSSLYLTFFDNNNPAQEWAVKFALLTLGGSGDASDREGQLVFISKNPSTGAETSQEVVIPNGLYPYAVIKDYDSNGTIGNDVDLAKIQACLGPTGLGSHGTWTVGNCTTPGISPVFEISPDGKRIFASFRMGRKIGGKMIYSKPMTKVFLVRGEKVES